MMERCPTGIPGLDELLEGGFPRGRVMLLAGGCGTGKSIMATQFLYNGAVEHGEAGVLVSFEQNPKILKEDMMHMGFDLQKLEDEKKLIIVDASLSGIAFPERAGEYTLSTQSSFTLDSVLGIISKAVQTVGAKRAIVDSFSALDSLIETVKTYGSSNTENVRRTMLGINYRLQSMGLTSVLISDVLDDGKISKYGIEEFMVDGVITMHYNVEGPDAGRHLIVRKMRNTKHSENINTIEFERGEGVRVHSL
ncbi:MAG: hypothetical protein GF416_09455 [Candidatus Altiarchaeales archaeon]|nr:hypothetical protein [Candidatus Altiarchaeales archaeon]MBD3417345.1 hypothetical protein [Candidatus Altiarchaeales archaeon]